MRYFEFNFKRMHKTVKTMVVIFPFYDAGIWYAISCYYNIFSRKSRNFSHIHIKCTWLTFFFTLIVFAVYSSSETLVEILHIHERFFLLMLKVYLLHDGIYHSSFGSHSRVRLLHSTHSLNAACTEDKIYFHECN
uniref:Uncharacterized protein n=1 Tax=Lepeophtheirus salmonis TaxID=72036 RepID=A0A0K2V3H1_LEPSM